MNKNLFFPLMLIAIAIPLMFFTGVLGSGDLALNVIYSITPEDYADSEEISAWLSEGDSMPEETHMLRYTREDGDELITTYLMYRPLAKNAVDIAVTKGNSLFDTNVMLYLTEAGEVEEDHVGYPLICITFKGDRFVDEFSILVNNEEVNVHLSETTQNPALS